jgi:hypothetical protein
MFALASGRRIDEVENHDHAKTMISSAIFIWDVQVVQPEVMVYPEVVRIMVPVAHTDATNSTCSTGLQAWNCLKGKSLLTWWRCDSKTAAKDFIAIPRTSSFSRVM